MTKLRNMFGLFALVCALYFIPNVYAEETQQVNTWSGLKECLKDETHTTCQLSGNIELDEAEKAQGYIMMKDLTTDKTLDLQGYTLNASQIIYIRDGNLSITGTSGKFIVDKNNPIGVYLFGNANVSVDNITMESSDAVNPNISTVISMGADGTTGNNHFTLGANAKIVTDQTGISLFEHSQNSVVDIKGEIQASRFGITINGNYKEMTDAPEITISSTAKLTGNGNGIYAAGYGIWNITGATIECGTGISIRSGKFNISNATINATGRYDGDTPGSGGTNNSGDAIDIVASDSDSYAGNIEISISGDRTTVSSENGYAIHEFGLGEGKTSEDSKSKVLKSIEIEDGNYAGKEGSISVEDSSSFGEVTEKFISGGTFTKDGKTDSVTATFLDDNRQEDGNGNVVPKKVTVNFHNGEKNTGSTEIDNSNILGQLADETVEEGTNYAFDGWYLDENFEERLTSDTVISEESIDLYAKYVVTVTLDGVDEEPTTITKGTKFTKPTNPTKEGYVFQGWYTGTDYKTEFNFASEINENTTIYAKFAQELGITVKGEEGTFDSLEGETYADIKEQLAAIIAKLEEEAEEANKHFGGFYYEDEEGNPVYVEDETILTEDIELVPYYVVEITIGEEVFTQEEELTLGEIVWSQFDNVEGKVLSHFVDEKGNKYTFDSQITEDITLTPVYVDETEVPNTLDNVTSTAMMTIVGFVTMLVAGVLAIKSRKA